MIDDELRSESALNSTEPETYVAPAFVILGTVEELTLGPDPGAGDVPTGVISF